MSNHEHVFTFCPVGKITDQPNAVLRCDCGADILSAYHDLEKQLAERDAALARCVEALKPFGKMADPYESFDGQHDFLRNHVVVDHLGTRITVGDFRDARTVLASLPTSAQATAKVEENDSKN